MGLSSWAIHFPQRRGSQYLACRVEIEMQFTRGSCLFSDLHSHLSTEILSRLQDMVTGGKGRFPSQKERIQRFRVLIACE